WSAIAHPHVCCARRDCRQRCVSKSHRLRHEDCKSVSAGCRRRDREPIAGRFGTPTKNTRMDDAAGRSRDKEEQRRRDVVRESLKRYIVTPDLLVPHSTIHHSTINVARAMSKRLFVAIDLPESTRQLVAGLDPHMRGVRWTEPDQMHLTLGFFGDVPEDVELKLREKLSAI